MKNADYSITEPPQQSQTIVFAAGEYQKNIHIVASAAKTAESEQTIILKLFSPIGDVEAIDAVNPPTNATAIVTIEDTKPAGLPKAGGLTVKPSNLVKPIPANIAKDVKVAGRTGSDWTFSVSQPLPADAYNPSVKVQYTFLPVALNQWTDYITLQHGKGSKWSAVDRHPFVCSKLFFRTVASAEGYPDQFGAPTQPFAVIGGPELALNLSAISDSDASGDTAHLDEVITYHFTAANVSHDAAATPAVLTVPIPEHTTFLSATNHNATATQIKNKKGVTTAVVWNFASLAKSTNVTEDLLVQIDVASMFSAKEQKKHPNGFGTILTMKGHTLSAPTQGIKAAPLLRDTFETEILGPIKLSVSRPSLSDTVKGGDLITYTLTAKNTSANSVNQVVVRDRIPLGTILDSVYVPDANGNSTNTVLPNPSAVSNPALVYVLLTDAKFLGKKKGAEVDISILDTDTVNKLVDAHQIAEEVKWPIGLIAANSQVEVKFTVRVLYDIADPNASITAQPTQIVNDDYDFTISGGISALYGNPPSTSGLTSTVTAAPPVTKPVVGLGKIAVGSHDLNNSIVHGNGSQQIAGLGEVTTVVQNHDSMQDHGFDYEIFYINSGNATAHHVVLHDVIPEGAQLLGFFSQSVNGAAAAEMDAQQFKYYDAAGNVMANVNSTNITSVHSMDIRLSKFDNLTPLPAGEYGVIRYTVKSTVAPAPRGKPATFIHALGGFNPKLRRSDPEQGAYITCADLLRVVPATPDDTLVKVVSEAFWNITHTAKVFGAQPGDIVPFDFTFTQNGDIAAANCYMDLVIPVGTTLVTSGQNAPAFTDGAGGTILTSVNNSAARLTFGTSAAQETRKLRVNLQVNTPLDPVLAEKKFIFFETDPVIKGTPVFPTLLALRGRVRLVTPLSVATSTDTEKQAVPLRDPFSPTLFLARSAPYTVQKGGEFTYTIAFANSGDFAATNVTVGMQIPYFTQFVSATNGIINAFNGLTVVPTPNLTPYTTTPRSAAQVKVTGAGPDIITWKFASLPAHSAGAIVLKVKISGNFADNCVKDHSLYISADNAASAVLAPNPIGTWVIGKPFDTSKWEVLGCFCEHLNIPMTENNHDIFTDYVNQLTGGSQVRVVGAGDGVHLENGVSVLQLGREQVLVLGAEIVASGGGNIVATGGGNIVATGGGNIVASGAGNAISVTNAAGLGTLTASSILDQQAQIVATGGGNIVATGGGNMIRQVGGSFSQLSNHVGGASIGISTITANIVATGGGNIVATGGGNVVATGGGNVVAAGGGNIVATGGGNAVPQSGLNGHDGASYLGHNPAGIISVSSGKLVSHDGGSIVATGGGNIVATGGGN